MDTLKKMSIIIFYYYLIKKTSTFSQFFVKICGCWCINILYGIKKTFFF